MRDLSVLIITKDEEATIGRCLGSLRFPSAPEILAEVVVVDSGSVDGTVEIARAAGASVVERAWDGYANQKNWGIGRTKGQWILFLDADEELTPEAANEIASAIEDADESIKGFRIERRNYFLGGWIRHCGWSPDTPIRLARREHCRFATDQPLFDVLAIPDGQGRLRAPFLHYSYPSISSYVQKMDRYSSIESASAGQAKVRHWRFYLLFGPLVVFIKMYILKRGFLDGWRGFILCGVSAFHEFAKYAKLYEKSAA